MRIPTLRHTISAAAMGALLLTSSACGDDKPEPLPPTTTAPTSTPTPTPTKPAWESKYTEQQLLDYRAALQRFEEYETESAPIWATGKYTPEAEAIFKRYWSVRQRPQLQLKQYAQNEVKLEGKLKVRDQRATKINAGLEVTIQQCVDSTEATVTQHGKPVANSPTPFLRIIHLDKPKGFPWLINLIEDPSNMGGAKPCSGG